MPLCVIREEAARPTPVEREKAAVAPPVGDTARSEARRGEGSTREHRRSVSMCGTQREARRGEHEGTSLVFICSAQQCISAGHGENGEAKKKQKSNVGWCSGGVQRAARATPSDERNDGRNDCEKTWKRRRITRCTEHRNKTVDKTMNDMLSDARGKANGE